MVELSNVVMCAFLQPENTWMFPWYYGRVLGPYGFSGLIGAVVVSSLIRRSIAYAVRRWFKEALGAMDPDYCSVCIHAVFVTAWLGWQGLQSAILVHGVDIPHRIRHPSPGQPLFEEFVAPGADVICMFVAYLIDDLFSRKITADIALHHALFIYYCSVGSGFGLFSFIGCVFMTGEISTPILSVRDILIKSGRNNEFLGIINVCFGATFFIFRVCLWTYGVYWHFLPAVWSQWDLLPQPTWLATIQVILTCLAPGLQYYWFALIVRNAVKRRSKGRPEAKKH